MPQITINEIDQSIYRRVINDDKVKVLIPGIASFGPVYDGATDSARSFTDITPFRKTFGYTEPEYNPFKNDVSRLYASQLIDRGAEVSFIRLNEGEIASLMDRDVTPTVSVSVDITGLEGDDLAAAKKDAYEEASAKFGAVVGMVVPTNPTTGKPTDANITASDETVGNTFIATLTSTVYYKGYGYQFSDYIKAIKAKWSGSFGNNLLLTFTPVTSKNREFTAQYSLVAVYRVEKTKESNTTFTYKSVKDIEEWVLDANTTVQDIQAAGLDMFLYDNSGTLAKKVFTAVDPDVTYATASVESITINTTTPASGTIVLDINRDYVATRVFDATTNTVVYKYTALVGGKRQVKTTKTVTTTTINKVHQLENHVITTNPNDKNYFEDVEFEFIEFEATDGARDKLTLLWSNVNIPVGGIDESLAEMNGFPEITLRVRDTSGIGTHFNAEALMTDGYDFKYSEETQAKLDLMFDGVATATGSSIIDQAGTYGYTILDVNRYLFDAYSKNGVCANVLNNLTNCYANYTDPYIYDFDFITSGGFNYDVYLIAGMNGETKVYVNGYDKFSDATGATTDSTTDVWVVSSGYDVQYIPEDILLNHAAMRELVTTRKDCIALCDVMPNWMPDLLTDYVSMVNTSYCTFHAPWCYCANPNDGTLVLMPPSFIFLYTMLSNLINNVESQKWFPPAGVTRATARIVQKPQYEIGSVILNKWQNDTLSRVNPIMKLKQFGYVIYGQYTAYMAPDEFTHSALESLNVRLVANCVKKQIFTTCMKLTFEPNNSRLWLTFYDAMDKYLSFMKRNGGLYDYKIEMNESTVTTDDINELRCPGKVWINPTRTAEFFDIDFIITDAGVTFTED